MKVTLQTASNRIDFFICGERFASYHYDGELPGFGPVNAPENRPVTRATNGAGVSLWLEHGDVNGVAFCAEAAPNAEQGARRGRIVTEEMLARRGSQTVGFQHTCAWLSPEGTRLLTEMRTIRALPGPGDGRILDWISRLEAPDDREVTLGQTEAALLRIQAASSLCPSGGGQMRNSVGDYGPEAMDGRSAAWCACVGVVQGQTVGFALLDHPANPWHPTPWLAREEGALSPSPFAWRSVVLAPGGRLTLRYRLLAHQGYVETDWATARLADYTHATL